PSQRITVAHTGESMDSLNRQAVELVDLETCLREATFVTVHTPLTPETEGLLGADELALLADSYLINCARGGIIDEAALADALADGTVAGAGLDTFADEPIDAEHPLVGIEEAVLTPHLGASTVAAQTDVSASVAQQALAALAGEPVSHAINAPSVDETVYQQIRPYVELAVTAGTIAAQLLEGRIGTVEVSYAGEIAAEDVEIITAAALQGVFEPLEWQVNTVNAPRIAADRGIEVTETKSRQSADFQSLIGVTVGDGETELGVFGTLFTGDEPRIVRIDEYRVDAIPHGRMLVATNADAPGVIGFIGTVLGEHAINIAGMYNARRDEPGGEAMTVYSLDDPIPPEVEAVLEEDDRIIDVTYLEL
ncbi:MAG: NAD(P)-dependent oxidoreductase, partial [Haloquadratum sp.]|nr:NAD(P)-dependent oxidoreductase [Haloquadratum sp.]